jgi:amino acid transporter
MELGSLADSSSHSASARSSMSSSEPGISSSRRLSLASNESNAEAGVFRPRSGSSYSVSSAFDFNTHLVPLTSSTDARYHPLGEPTSTSGANVGTLEKQKTLTYLNGMSLLIGLIVGSGIFSSPSQVNNHVPSPGVSLIVWAVAGFLAWTGAASYAELGGAIPLNGGSGVYLRHCFGELASFLYSWTAIIVLKPGSAAIIAIISGEYINRVLSGSFGADDDTPLPSPWANKLAAVVCLLVVTTLNVISTKLTTRLSDGMMFVKVGTLLALTIIGIIVAVTGLNGDGKGANTDWKDKGWFDARRSSESDKLGGLGEYAIALYAGLWAFDGWDNVPSSPPCLSTIAKAV